jgi:superfamily II DNA or RNA helicase
MTSNYDWLIDTVLDNPAWNEPVRVERVKQMGSHLSLRVVGLETNQYRSAVLSIEEVEKMIGKSAVQTNFLSGDPVQFRLASEAKRIHLAYLHDPLFAVSMSQIDPLPHQLEAVYNYMLPQPRLRFMLADDPGAGKTIMAGLLLKELKLRGVIKRVLIVTPGGLWLQWRRELRERFGEHFDRIDRGFHTSLGSGRAWNVYSQVITSIDFAKQPDILESLSVAERWDLVIVDECHKMSAYRRGPTKVERSQRYRLGELLSDKTDRLLLLTATPHKGDPENFRFLLSLLDPDLFADRDVLQRAVQRQENPIFLRRLKEHMLGFDGKPLFPPRKAITPKFKLSSAEMQLYDAVTHYVQHNFNLAMEAENRNVTFALIVLQRRLASSLHAIYRSLESRHERLQNLRKKVLEDPDTLVEQAGEHMDDPENAEDESARELSEEQVLRYTVARNIEELEAEIIELEKLIRLAGQVKASGEETKLTELRRVMENKNIRDTDEKLLVFTEAKDTLNYLLENIRNWGYKTTFIDGSVDMNERVQREHEFRDPKGAQIMVATDAASEGINLQFCHLMVNYDVPWNPTRLEQRLGRIHRYGQETEVFMYNLVAEGTREGDVIRSILEKLDRMSQGMGGDRVFDVIDIMLEDVRLEDLIVEAITERRLFSDILAGIEVTLNEEQQQERLRELTLETLSTQYVDVQGMSKRKRLASENMLAPAFIRSFFIKAMEAIWPGRLDQRADGFYRIRHVPADLREIPDDIKMRYGIVQDSYNVIIFDKDLASKHDTGELVGPGHSLFEAVSHHILQRFSDSFTNGSILMDADGQYHGIVWLVEGAIQDGMDNTVGRKLSAIYQPFDGTAIQELHPGQLMDFDPPEHAVTVPDEAQTMLANSDELLGWYITNMLATYQDELQKRRDKESEIVERYLKQSFRALMARSQGMLTGYYEKQEQGRDMRLKIREEEARFEGLKRRQQDRLEQVQREQSLTIVEPHIVSFVAVLSPDQLQVESGTSGTAMMRRDDEVERAAIETVLAYEAARGWTAEDISEEKRPWDITSISPDGNEIRYIEVKGRAGKGIVEMHEREWLYAMNHPDESWLYVVSYAKEEPQLSTIPNPTQTLRSDEVLIRNRYQVSVDGWKRASITE